MKGLIIRLILTVSIPIIIGVAISMIIFYKNLMNALLSWESDSLQWIKQQYQQTLYNQLLSQLIIEEYSFNQIQLQLIVLNKLIDKYNDKKILVNSKTQFTICSYRELVFNQCSPDVYVKFQQSPYFVDVYFVRSIFKFDLLSKQQQDFILMNNLLSFYSRSVAYQSQQQGILKIIMFFNSDATSIYTRHPSEYTNVTNTPYLHCYGDGFLEPYDPRCRPWYIYAKEHEGYFFYEPYKGQILQSLQMTLSSQVKIGQNFQSINSISFDMSNLIQIFFSSKNQYAVLFHEFNNTIFYHPQFDGISVISWQELEFKNISQNCITQIDLEKCNQEKEQLNYQLQQTIQFIKTGDYSINQQKNLDQLYQYWSKFGVKKISLVFPLVSKISKYKTQQPYSFSIILTAMVIDDQSERLQLFNIININWIKVPLIIEFIIISLMIIIFLLNYGKFQIIQIQNPINILIKFLKINLILQSQTQYTNKLDKQNFLSQNSSKYKKSPQNTNYKVKYNEITNSLFSPFNQVYLKETLKNNVKVNENHLINKEKTSRENTWNQSYLDKVDTNNGNQVAFGQKYNNKTIQNDDKYYQNRNNKSEVFNTQEQKQEQEQEQKSKILDGLEPLFLEMAIIKETFQNLESMINYQIDAQSQSSEDIMNGLFHFAKAKGTFQKLQNQNGVIHCYYNLGVVYLIKNDFQLASEYFLSSIQLNSMLLDIDHQQIQLQKYAFAQYKQDDDQLALLIKKILCFAYSLKQLAIEQIYDQIKSNLSKSSNSFYYELKYHQQKSLDQQILQNILKKSIDNFRILENFIKIYNQNVSKLFQLFVYLEIIEILIHLDLMKQIKQIQFYIDKTIILIQKQEPQYMNSKLLLENSNGKKINEFESFQLEQDIPFSFSSKNENLTQEIRFMIFEIFKAKLMFLQGKLEFYQENYCLAIEYFTQSIEEGQYFSHVQRQNSILYLSLIFQKLSIKQDFIDEFILNSSVQIELTLLIQMDFFSQNTNLSQFFENIQQSKLLRKKDGIQIIIFNKKLQTVIPLTLIESFHHLKLIIESFKNRAKQTIQSPKKIVQKLNWQQALIQCIGNITNLNLLQINKLKQDIKEWKNSNNDLQKKSNYEILKHNMKMLENKKQVIILFSYSQDIKNNIIAKQFFDKKIQFHSQKIIIYHMIDQFILYSDQQYQYVSESFQYQPVVLDKDLIQKLGQLRTDQLNTSKQFITILNNAL
ncbi:tetratricopeptide repeat protein (macronuclear) [Tetrahymena thermophila SB210]|uniref:Tetratricopeptide repeat protein n=1 Tax=Tetrahymena thermophila (strain SB210) TaxID=312017 RepID=I7LUT8_TETTS|nr:tetratricopeptide repeat protein [Tetrahymena thermophila SB210]EAR96024.2 tetratricopeptide repeat protein [Tetrahymena thermophila SB210]|eukprot:XP_001016269.2 tetratricopeptide repeat protein [Tetrahymena thermophila SB210]